MNDSMRAEAHCFMDQAKVSSLPDFYGHRHTKPRIFCNLYNAKEIYINNIGPPPYIWEVALIY